MARRLRCLQDFAAEGLDVLVECGNHNCRRRVIADPERLHWRIRVPWRRELYWQASQLRCKVCGYKGADTRIAPMPKFVHPLDCEEFQADINAMWERVMTEEERRQLNGWQIEGPDDDGFVWICSSEGRDDWCRNLGHADDAAEKFSQWLGSIDYLQDK